MDTLINRDIAGLRVKIIDEDNDAIWGTVETVDYVKGKIGLMADGQNGRLEYYFKCDIKKIFVIDENNSGTATVKDDRRAFDSSVSDLDKSFFYSVDSSISESYDKIGDMVIDKAGDKIINKIDEKRFKESGDKGFKESDQKSFNKIGDESSNIVLLQEAPVRKSEGINRHGGSDPIHEYGHGGVEISSLLNPSDKNEKPSSDYEEVPGFFKASDRNENPTSNLGHGEVPNYFKKADKLEKPINNLRHGEVPRFFRTSYKNEKPDTEKRLGNIVSESREPDLSSQTETFRTTTNPRKWMETKEHNSPQQEARRPDRLLKKGIKTENVHLRNLHHVDMNNILGRTNVEQTEELKRYVDNSQFPFFMLPSVSSTSALCQDINGQVVNPSKQQRVIRELLWKSPTEPPVLHTPARLYIIEEIGDLFEEAIERCRLEPAIGVSLEGELLGRVGQLCYLVLSTVHDVFFFDILELGKGAFEYGLKSILQDEDIIKVFHDVRQPSDILFHQYNINLENIFDTLAADIVFHLNWSVHKGFIQQYARALPHMAKEYLGVADSDLFFPKYRRSKLKEDSSIWRQRPLPHHLIIGAVRRTIYLLPLQAICREAVQLPFKRGVSALLSCVRDADEPDAATMVHETAYLPSQVRSSLPKWNLDAAAIERSGLKVDGIFVHQNVGSIDPQLIFSKDAMHQSDPHFKSIGKSK